MSLKTVIRVVVGAAVVFCAVVAVGLGYLIYPGQPGSSRYLKFEGYILLPKHGLFNGEDYLTLQDKTLWVAGMLSGSVFRVSLDSDTPSANRVAEWREEPRVHGIALAPPHELAFVTRSELNVVDAFSPSRLVPVARIPVANDPAKLRRAFIVCGGNAMLVVFDLADDRIVTSMAIGSGPDVVDFDPVLKRIYATGLAGTLSIVQQKSADTYELLDEISTHFGAHTLAVDPVTHKVYIAYASLMVAPRVTVFSSLKD